MHSNANIGEQNGRQPPLPGQLSTQRPLQDPPKFGNQNAAAAAAPFGTKVDICRDFLWGTCIKTTQCKYRHELDFEEMKKVLRFCHDHQNRSGCIREDCTYLHVTKDEESLFLTSGQLPRVLAERHSNMIAATNTAETIPQIALFIKESFVNAPPPPPPPPPPVSASSPPYTGTSPRTSSAQQPPPPPPPPPPPAVPSTVASMPSVVNAVLAPPNPPMPTPPPPTPFANPMTINVARTVPGIFGPGTTSVYTGPSPNVIYPVNMPPPTLPPMFDASVPPPPLPPGIQTKSGAIKRRTATEAGPSKVKKAEDFRLEDEQCPNCLQLQLRIDACRQDMQQLEIEEEFQKIIFQNKTKEYENMKYILRSLVRPEVCRILEEHIEGVPQFQLQDILTEINQASSVSSSLSSVMMMFFEYLLKNSRSTPAPPLRTDDALLQSVANLTRNLSMPSSPSSVLDVLTGLIRNSSTNASPLPPKIDLKLNTTANTNGVNGFGRYNGPKEDAVPRVPPCGYMTDQRLRSPVAPSTAQSHPGPSGYSDFTLSAPPPTRPYYNQPYTVPNNTNINYYQTYRSSTPMYGGRGSMPAEGITNVSNKDACQYVMGTRYPAPPQ